MSYFINVFDLILPGVIIFLLLYGAGLMLFAYIREGCGKLIKKIKLRVGRRDG